MMLEREHRAMEEFRNKENLQRLERVREFEANQLNEKLLAKNLRVHEFQRQKELIQQEKQVMAEEIHKSKEQYLEKFGKILQKKKLNVNK